jgi:RNA polymerase sigma factor (sigma-70 family)
MNEIALEKRDAGGAGFDTTNWSVVYAAQGDSEGARAALEKICYAYWRPIYSFVRREGRSVEDAQDLTQGFFARVLERRDLDTVRKEKGRLRSYLLTALKHFLANERQRTTSAKRGGGRPLVSLEEMAARERSDPEPADILTADKIYERRWALTVFEQTMEQLARDYDGAENAALFPKFKNVLADDLNASSQASIAQETGMTENAVKQAYLRFRRRYRELLLKRISQTVAVPGDVEDELRHLIAILRA